MAVYTAARYTGTALTVLGACSLLVIAAIHGSAGVATAVLPLVAGVVLLWSATVLAPVVPYRPDTGFRRDAVLFCETVGFAVVSMAVFVGLGILV